MPAEQILFELRDGIALLGLNRPDKCNAFDEAMTRQFTEAVRRANEEARVCIIFACGRHFSAGLDLNWLRDRMAQGADQKLVPANEFATGGALELIFRSHIPYIAAVNGAAIGLGFELAAAAHIRVADETAYFCLPEAKRGIFVGGGGAARISRLIGVARMQDMMLTGRTYDAVQSSQVNIAQYVVPAGKALERATELATAIRDNSPVSNYAILNALPRIHDMSIEEGIYWEAVISRTTFGEEAIARLSRFLDGRGKCYPPRTSAAEVPTSLDGCYIANGNTSLDS